MPGREHDSDRICTERLMLATTLFTSITQSLDATMGMALAITALDVALVGAALGILALKPSTVTFDWRQWIPIEFGLSASIILAFAVFWAGSNEVVKPRPELQIESVASCPQLLALVLTTVEDCRRDLGASRNVLSFATVVLVSGVGVNIPFLHYPGAVAALVLGCVVWIALSWREFGRVFGKL